MKIESLNYNLYPQYSQMKKSNSVNFSSLYSCEIPTDTEKYSGLMKNVSFSIALGDMTHIKADAYIVPEFDNCASYGGVGGAIARTGAEQGIDEYQKFVDKNGAQEFSSVVLTDSHGGNSKKLLHAVTIGAPKETEFNTVHNSVYNALVTAKKNNIRSVVCPAMGTGIIGSLTDEQSAKAILSAVKKFADEGNSMDFCLVVHGDKSAFTDFKKVMNLKLYENAQEETGQKAFDPQKFINGIFNNYFRH